MTSPTADALLVGTGIGAVLVVATAVGMVLARTVARGRPHAAIDNLNDRVRAWWVMTLVGGLAVAAGDAGITLLFAFASCAALAEFVPPGAAAGRARIARRLAFGVALPLQYAFLWAGWLALASVLVPCWAIATALALRHEVDREFARALTWGLVLCVLCVSYVPALLALPIPAYDGRNALLVVFLVVVVQASDVLQYIWGTLAGRHRIAPRISPAKTVEGTIGGIASATALGATLAWITPFTVAQAAAVAAALTTLGFLGGLAFSALKRRRGIKDWGTLIGGHGGMLDRLDSLCLPAPFFYALLRIGWTG